MTLDRALKTDAKQASVNKLLFIVLVVHFMIAEFPGRQVASTLCNREMPQSGSEQWHWQQSVTLFVRDN